MWPARNFAMTFSSPLHCLRPALWFGAILLLVTYFEHFAIGLPSFSQEPLLPAAVSLDLLLLLPGLFYFMVVRRYQLPLTSVVGAFGGCLALAYWLIPVEQQQYLGAAGQVLGLLEVVLVTWAVVNVRRIGLAYYAARKDSADFMENLGQAFQQVLGRPLALLVSEISIIRYALLGWWGKAETRPEDGIFTSHRESGFTALAAVMCLAMAIETSAVHLLVGLWSHTAANWLLVADIYTLLLLMGHGHAVRLRPSFLTSDELVLRVGFAWKLTVDPSDLVLVETLQDAPEADSGIFNMSKLLLTAPNLLLTFAEPVVVVGPYGIRRSASRVAVYFDQPQQFIAAVGNYPQSPTL